MSPGRTSAGRCRSLGTRDPRFVHGHGCHRIRGDLGGLGERGAGSSSAASADSSSSDAAVHRPCRSTQRRTSVWLGTAQQRASPKNRTSCGRRIMPGVWPAKSTRRSSSPWVVPWTRPKLWLEPCRARSDECATGNRLRCTATPPSAQHPLSGTSGYVTGVTTDQQIRMPRNIFRRGTNHVPRAALGILPS